MKAYLDRLRARVRGALGAAIVDDTGEVLALSTERGWAPAVERLRAGLPRALVVEVSAEELCLRAMAAEAIALRRAGETLELGFSDRVVLVDGRVSDLTLLVVLGRGADRAGAGRALGELAAALGERGLG